MMKRFFKYIFLLASVFILVFSFTKNIYAQQDETSFHIATYITGIGCPHCANVAPGLLKEKVNECQDNMIIIEYEIYKTPQNSSVIFEFNSNYGSGLGIPLVIFDKDNILVGDTQINKSFDNTCINVENNAVALPNEDTVDWYSLDLNTLPYYPRIWSKDKIAVRTENVDINSETNKLIIDFLSSEDPETIINNSNLVSSTSSEKIEISGGEVEFKNAVTVDGWLLEWNGNTAEVVDNITKDNSSESTDSETKISFIKTVTLALADSVNPCAIAILLMMLIAIVTYNPKDRKAVLLSGFSFIGAVVVMYFAYGILIVKFFDLIQSFKGIQSFVTPVLSIFMGVFCLILGLLEVKDFVNYKPGSFATEMPMNLRPKVQKLISKVTSPLGALVLGMFVTLFLLPCTIGPYFILGGLISTGSTSISTMLPYLILYNVIFVLPMVAIVFLIFFGVKNIEDVKNWKDKNVRIMHLTAGFLLSGLAIWVLIENIPTILSLLK